jgi:hypothetical protein
VYIHHKQFWNIRLSDFGEKGLPMKNSTEKLGSWIIVSGVLLIAREASAATRFSPKPSAYSATLGLNTRSKAFFSQERYYQESWLIAGALHWPLLRPGVRLMTRVGYEKFSPLPRNKSQIGITSSENRVALEVGVEYLRFVSAGFSSGGMKVSKESKLEVGDYISDQSSDPAWKETFNAPFIKAWIGVPMVPETLLLNLSLQQAFFSKPEDERTSFGVELRYEY